MSEHQRGGAGKELPPLFVHIESYLGQIARGVRGGTESDRGVLVGLFDARPIPGATSYCTMGLSNHVLSTPGGKRLRMELVGCSYSRFAALHPEGNLLNVASQIVHTHRAPLRGEVIGPAGPIVAGSSLEAYYCCPPSFLPSAFGQLGDTEPATVFVWLLPIARSEADYVARQGWSPFEDLLESSGLDYLDLGRQPVV